jgi:peptidoglycan/xylan/chitin deacetylase (PgdA/CDA1 family)
MNSATHPWQWDEPTWRAHVTKIRAGRSLSPPTWPGGASVAVAISFDSDHETMSLREADLSAGHLSQGEYGSRRGADRVLRLLREHDIPATFFVPAVSALLHPEEIERYIADGHELALHGWIHERNQLLDEASERDLTWRAAEVLERIGGRRPVGMRTPSWDFSDATLRLEQELGLLYDSSLMADDEPYEILADGQSTGIVEVPVEWIRDDYPYLVSERYTAIRPHTPPQAVTAIWRDEFDLARSERGLFQLTMHPHIIGHRSRIVALAELLAYLAGHSGVWFATHEQIARHCGAPLASLER